jgi:hypothetical protein
VSPKALPWVATMIGTSNLQRFFDCGRNQSGDAGVRCQHLLGVTLLDDALFDQNERQFVERRAKQIVRSRLRASRATP